MSVNAPLGLQTVLLCVVDPNGNAVPWDGQASGGSGGTVTSVGLTAPSIFTVTNSPITGSGNLALSLNTQVANTVFAGPASGADATPTFRALVKEDIPTSLRATSFLGSVGVNTATPGTGFSQFIGLEIKNTTAGGAQVFAVRDSNIAHGMTSLYPTDVTTVLTTGTQGGFSLFGLAQSNTTTASIAGLNVGASTTIPVLSLLAAKKSGTSVTALADTDLLLNVDNNSTHVMKIFGNGNVIHTGALTLGSSIQAPTAVSFSIPIAPTVTPNAGLISLGSGPFDGVTSGFFAGNSNGTHIAVNAALGYLGRLMDLQIAGVRVFGVGRTTVASATSGTLNAIESPANTVTITGATAITTAGGFNYFTIGQPTYTAASAVAITNGSTFVIAGAPLVAGSATLTNKYALWVQADTSRFDGPILETVNGALSAPGATLNGTWIATGGTATTTKPYVLIEPTGTTSTGWSTSGTGLGINAASGFTGPIADFQVAGVSWARIDTNGIYKNGGSFNVGQSAQTLLLNTSNGAIAATFFNVASAILIGWAASSNANSAADTAFARLGAASVRQGLANSATPVAQTFTIGESSRAGTDTNVGGASGTFRSGLGTGTGTAATLIFQTPTVTTSGTGTQSYATRLTLDSASLTSTVAFRMSSLTAYEVYNGANRTGFFADLGALSSVLRLASSGQIGFSASSTDANTSDTVIRRLGVASFSHGNVDSATPVAQLVTIGESSRAGTDTNVGGSSGTIRSGLGTGTGTVSTLIFQTPTVAGSGTGAQTYVTRLLLDVTGAAVTGNVNISSGGINIIGNNTIDFRTIGGIRLGVGALISWSSANDGITSIDTWFSRAAAATFRFGNVASATPVANTLTIGESSRSGTDTNTAGANGTLRAGLGTGTAAGTLLAFQSSLPTTTGTGVQSYVTGLAVFMGTAVLTSYIVSALPSAVTVGAGATAFVTDANTTLVLGLGLTVVGGGANKVPVYSDGTNWIVG